MITARQFLAEARAQLGKPYVYGGAGPDDFDCAGLVFWCLQQVGITSVPRGSEAEWAWCQQITELELRPGDLIFEQWPGDNAPPGHVVIYAGNGNVYEAPHSGADVWERAWSPTETTIVGYGRVPGLTWNLEDSMYYEWLGKTYYVSGGRSYLLVKNGLVAIKAAEAAGQIYIIPDQEAGLFNTFPVAEAA